MSICPAASVHRFARRLIRSSSLAVFAVAATVATAQAQDKMELRKVADDVYMMENMRGSGNSSFVVTPEGVLVFDADIRTADQVLAEIRKLTDKKVRYLVLSHSAGDHATGGWHYREDNPVVIATRRQMRDLFMQEARQYEERMASTRPDDAAYRNRPLRRPDIGFDGAMTLQFGGLTFQMSDEGHGHSTSDLTIYIPQKRVFLMGDLLSNQIHPGKSLKEIQDNFEVPAEFAAYQRKPRLVNMLNLFYTQVIDQGFADTKGR